jgi:hypothetical protein
MLHDIKDLSSVPFKWPSTIILIHDFLAIPYEGI